MQKKMDPKYCDWSPPHLKDSIVFFMVAGLGIFLHVFMSTEQSGWKHCYPEDLIRTNGYWTVWWDWSQITNAQKRERTKLNGSQI